MCVGGGLMLRPPFVWLRTQPDPDTTRLFFGKSFIYPLVASPFVKIFGTNGFLLLHALLLAARRMVRVSCSCTRAPPAVPSVILAGAFVVATVVPVYFVWITPELFNFALGFFAFFCWLYKEVCVQAAHAPRHALARWSESDLAAAALIGVATFSKPTNAPLIAAVMLLLLWRRRDLGAPSQSRRCSRCLPAGCSPPTWRFQASGTTREASGETFNWEFPFQTPQATFEGIDTKAMARDDALADVVLDRSAFFRNLTNNLRWYFVGRYSGLIAYFPPAVFAMVAFLAGARRRPLWQWLVFGSAVAQILLFVISLPHTWFGGGGSVGNRYFMGAYGIFLFMLPPIASVAVSIVPWLIAGLFIAKLVLNPFVSSFRPGTYADCGPLRSTSGRTVEHQ